MFEVSGNGKRLRRKKSYSAESSSHGTNRNNQFFFITLFFPLLPSSRPKLRRVVNRKNKSTVHLPISCACVSNHSFNRHPFPVNCNHCEDYKFKHRSFYRSEHLINCLCLSQNYPICIHCRGKRFSTTTNTPCLKSPITTSTSVEDVSVEHASVLNHVVLRSPIDRNRLSVATFRPTSFDERQLRRNRLIPLNFLRSSIPVRGLDSSNSDKLRTFGEQIRPIRREKSAFLKSSSFNSFECDSYAIIDRPRSALEIYANANASGYNQLQSSASPDSKPNPDGADAANAENKLNKNIENVEIKRLNGNCEKAFERDEKEKASELFATVSYQTKIESKSKNDICKNNENDAHAACVASSACDGNANSDASPARAAGDGERDVLAAESSNSDTKPAAKPVTKSPKKLSQRRQSRRSKCRKPNSNVGASTPLQIQKVYSMPSDESFTDEHSNESFSDDVFEPPAVPKSFEAHSRRRRSSSLENLKTFQKQALTERPNSSRSRSVVSINDKPQYFDEKLAADSHPTPNASNSLPSIANRNLCFPNKSADHSLVSIMSQKRGPHKHPSNRSLNDVSRDGSNEYDIRDRIRGHGSDNGNQRFYRDNSEQDSLRGHTDRSKHAKDNDSFNRSTSTAEGTSEDKVGKSRNQWERRTLIEFNFNGKMHFD